MTMAFVLGEIWTTKEWSIVFSYSLIWIFCFWRYIIRKEKIKEQLKITVVLFILFLSGIRQMEQAKQKDIYFPLTQKKEEIIVKGEVDRIQKTAYGKQIYLTKCIISAEKIDEKEKCLTILMNAETDFEGKVGNHILVKGELQAFSPSRNPGEFNSNIYYKALGIDYKIKASSYEITDISYHHFKQFLMDVKEHLSYIFSQICTQKDYGIFQAILLGEKQELDSTVKQLYQESGISHILAISGLHISLIGMGMYQIFRKKMGFITAGVLSSVCMAAYVMMTGAGISSIRAYIMFAVLLLSYMLGRTYDMLSAASLIAGILLWQSPFLLCHSGFLLSFGAVAGIGGAAKILKQYFHCSNKLEEAFFSSFAVFLVTLPIICYYYFEAAPYSIILNLIILPCMTWIAISGILGVIGGMIFRTLGKIFIGMGHFLFIFYEQLCFWIQKLPKAVLLIGRPSTFQIIIYYFILGITGYFLFYQSKKEKEKEICKKEKHKRIVYGIIITIVLLFCLSLKEKGRLTVVFLDVSQGDGIYIETPSKSTYFIDGGSADVSNLAKNRIVPFLKSNQTKKLDYVFITHADNDHISGIVSILQEQSVLIKTLVLPETNLKDEPYQNLVTLAKENQIEIIYLKKGDQIIDGEVRIECLHPKEEFIAQDRNEYSAVLSMVYRDFSVLFTGDLENEGEKALLEEKLSSYDILKVAHHGSKNATTKELLEHIKPKIAVISCGIENRYGHPHQEVLERLEGIPIYQTKESGAITIKTDGKNIEIKTHLKENIEN